MTTQQSEAYTEDYGSDGFNAYDAQDELGQPNDELTGIDLGADEEAVAPEAPEELPPDPIEEREKALETKEAQFAEQQDNLELHSQLRGYGNQQLQAHARELEQQGYYPEQIEKIARDRAEKDIAIAAYQIQNKRNLEKLISLETGIPRTQLKDIWDEQAMRDKAAEFKRSGGAESQVVKNLEARVARAEAALRRNNIPAQTYNQPGRSAGGGSDADLIRRYANGQINMSPRVQQALDR